jgi:hypothetical protein
MMGDGSLKAPAMPGLPDCRCFGDGLSARFTLEMLPEHPPTIFWHTVRMSETDPLTLHQADQDRTDFDFAAIESDLKFIIDRIAGTADAQGLGEDTVDLDFLGCRHATRCSPGKARARTNTNGASSRRYAGQPSPSGGWTPNMVLDDRGDATKILHDKHPCNAQIGSISVPSRAPLTPRARRRALADIAEAADDGELAGEHQRRSRA